MSAPGGSELHADFDADRWLTAAGYEGRLLLGYNPHTHRGRIGVWSEVLGTGTRISASDVIDASPLARAWIDGFLAGNEPGPHDMFGDQVDDLPSDHPKMLRWRSAVSRFRATGTWDGGYWIDLAPIDTAAPLVQPAWTLRGDEVWLWDGSRWSEADPQPGWTGGGRPGTPCAERKAHQIAMISDRHGQCEHCGEISQFKPD